jgi:GTP cyclohydrolase II
MVTSRVPTPFGEFHLSLYHNGQDDKEHLALVRGVVTGRSSVLVRVHSECFTGDVLTSERCDCGDQLEQALALIEQEGCGAVIYLRQEGRGIGLLEKLKAYNLQDQGHDTVDANRLLGHAADERDYSLAARILEDLDILSVRLLTNNPAKVDGLVEHGIEVSGRVPILAPVKAENAAYLRTKADRMRHHLDIDEPAGTASAESRLVDELRADADNLQQDRTRPFVTLTYAQSVDGCIATEADHPLTLSGPESLALTHELRGAHDAILVGIGTVLADDPRLTARLENVNDPQPVVLDSQLRLPLDARLLSGSSPWIVTAEDADPRRQAALEAVGARVLRLPTVAAGRISLEHLLKELHERGIARLMVEGGAAVISSFLTSRQVDHLVLTVAPTLIGGLPAIGRQLNGDRPNLPRLRGARYRQLGEDLILWGAPEWQ